MTYNIKNKVLVLGGTGLLGSMVVDFMRTKFDIEIASTFNSSPLSEYTKNNIQEFKFDATNNTSKKLENILKEFEPDYIINCIGIIKPWCKDNDPKGIELAVRVNAMFPYLLSEVVDQYLPETKIIQIATDCVYDGSTGAYKESAKYNPNDVYGRTKSLGEVVNSNFLNIRTSIIGPEIKNHLSLLEWFLNSSEQEIMKGYDHHKWNGVTTLQFSQFCYDIIKNRKFEQYREIAPRFHYVINDDVSKYDLLTIIKRVFKTNHQIEKVNEPLPAVNRTLRSELFNFETQNMEYAVVELKDYILNSELYNSLNRINKVQR